METLGTLPVNTIPDLESYNYLASHTGDQCLPSPDSVDELRQADIILFSGQFVGAGKSTLITELEKEGRINIASWTNRDLRPGEREGIDKCHRPFSEMAKAAHAGFFLELEEVRPKVFYATPAVFKPEQEYVKDLELKGALRLRSFDPELPIVVPLPPLDDQKGLGITEWEHRVTSREGLDRAVSDKAIEDLWGRLEGVVEECDRILQLDLLDDPKTLILINDDLEAAVSTMNRFLLTGDKPDNKSLIQEHLTKLRDLVLSALEAY